MLITLQKYLLREWLTAFIGVSIILLLVVVGVFANDMLNSVADGSLPPGLLGSQLLLRLPEASQLIIPLALFIAVMLGLGRLHRDQEMAVMRACGFHWHKMLLPLAALVLPVALILLVMTFWLGPRASLVAGEQLQNAYQSAVVWGLKPGQFHSMQQGQFVVYVESMAEQGGQFEKVFIYQKNGPQEQVWNAERGDYWIDPDTGNRYLSLFNGQVTDSRVNALDYHIASFKRADLKLPEIRQKTEQQAVAKMNLSELMGQNDQAALAELHWRLSPALAVILLGLLAIPLAHSAPHDSRFSRLVLGMLVYAVYANILTLGRVWLDAGTLPASSGLWWVHAGLLLLTLLWLRQQGRKLRI